MFTLSATDTRHTLHGHDTVKHAADVAKEAHDYLTTVDSSGATVSTVKGRIVPSTGYVVAVPGHARVIGSLSLRYQVRRYADDNRSQLAWRGRFLGIWFADSSRGYVLDVVEIVRDRETGLQLGRDRGEEAIFDLSTGSEIFCS